MFRTAVPFGYLLITLFLFAALILGIGILVWGWRRRSRKAKWIGGGLIGAIVAAVTANAAFDASLELNPNIVNDADIVGTWTNRVEVVTLTPDHTFRYRVPDHTFSGTWTRDDWNLYLHSATDGNQTMRFIQFRGNYRLLTRLLGAMP